MQHSWLRGAGTVSLVIGILLGLWAPAVADGILPVGVPSIAGSSGLYPSPNDPGCCWLARDATVRSAEPPEADVVILTVAVPPFAAYAGGTTLSLRIDGSAPVTRCCIKTGVSEVAFPLPEKHRATTRDVTLAIHSSTTFVPALVGLRQDDRRVLAVLLRAVTFQNTVSGERYVNGAPLVTTSPATAALDIAVAVLGALATFIFGLRDRRVLWVALLVTAPFTFALGVSGTTLMLPKAVLVSGILCMLVRPPHFERSFARFSWLAGAIGLLIISCMLSDTRAHSVWPALRETLKQVEYAATFALAYVAYRSRPDESFLRTTVAAVAAVVSVLAFAQGFFGANEFVQIFGHDVPRFAGPLEGPNQLGAFLVVAASVLAACINVRKPALLEAGALAVSAIAILLTLSRGGILSFGIALFVVAVLRWRPRYGQAAFGVLALVWVAGFAATLHAAFSAAPFATRVLGASSGYNGGLGTRSDLWHAAGVLWRGAPWLGVGPGNFELEVGTLVPGVKTHANNYYLQMLAEQGVLGLVSYLLVVAASVWALLRQPQRALAIAGLAAVVSLAFHQLLDGLLMYPKIGVFFWTLIGIAVADQAGSPPSPNPLGRCASS